MLPKLTLALMVAVATQIGGGQVIGGGQGSPEGRQGMPGGGMGMSSAPTQFEQFVSKLKLDQKTQVPAVQQIFSAAASEASTFERDMMQLRLKMLDVITNDAEMKKTMDAYSVAAAKMTSVEVRAFDEVRSLLKPGQLAHSVEAFEIMAGIFHPPTPRGGMFGGRRGGGGEALRDEMGSASMAVPQRGGGTGGGIPGSRGGGGMRGMGMRTAPTRQVAFAAMFGLTDEQKKQMKRVLDDEYKNAEPLRKELETSRETIGLAIRDEQSAPVVDQAVTEYSVPVAAMAAAEMKALVKVLSILPEDSRPSKAMTQTAAYLMRGAFVGKKWDTAPDTRFY